MSGPDDAPGTASEPPSAAPSHRSPSTLFRDEALRHHFRAGWEGDVLRLTPAWTRWTYPFLLLSAVAAVSLLAVGWVREHVEGPALVRLEGVTDVVAPVAGILEPSALREGDGVGVGEVVAVLRAGTTRHEVASPVAGSVHALRASPGRAVAVGEPLLSVAPSPPRFGVIALLPGAALSRLRPGQRLRVFLDGAPRSPLETTVETLPREVVGPAAARRGLPPAIADVPSIEAPVAVLTAALPAQVEPGRPAPTLREGMTGRAEVEVGAERLLFALVPGLERNGGR